MTLAKILVATLWARINYIPCLGNITGFALSVHDVIFKNEFSELNLHLSRNSSIGGD